MRIGLGDALSGIGLGEPGVSGSIARGMEGCEAVCCVQIVVVVK